MKDTQGWVCTIRTPSNVLQTIEVQAYNRSDAISIAESSTGGKCSMATVQGSGAYQSSGAYQNSADSSNGNTEISGGTVLFGLVCLLLLFAWKWILLIGGVALICWVGYLITNED